MAYTAIVLDDYSRNRVIERARECGLFQDLHNPKTFAHHVTLAMGDHSARWTVGTPRKMTVVKVGWVKGRVAAFMVEGAADGTNNIPHITIATSEGAKPRDSNEIGYWHALSLPFEITGTIQVCH